MNENKHQFHVGDWVDFDINVLRAINPASEYYFALKEAICNGPHRVADVKDDDVFVLTDAPGCEKLWCHYLVLQPSAYRSATPIDDLI